jgi:hypothetical protein
MTPLQQTFLLCFVVYPLVVVIQSFWIIWLVWFSRRESSRHLHSSWQYPQRKPRHSHLRLRKTDCTSAQVTVVSEAAEPPARRQEVNVL